MANIAYVRVSTVEQNDERQREAGGHRLCLPAGRPAGPADIPPGQCLLHLRRDALFL